MSLFLNLSRLIIWPCNEDMGKSRIRNCPVPMFFSSREQDNIPGKYLHLFFFSRTDAFPGSNNQQLVTGMDVKLVSYALSKIDLGNNKLFTLFTCQY
jgi:hypothetical protein